MVKGTVLVVDDAPGIVHLLQLLLEQAGYRVVTAVGAAVLPLAREVQPDVILLDVMMPGLDGPATLRSLRTVDALAAVPVVFFTAKAQRAEIAELLALGAADVLGKPFDPMTLGDALRAIWARHNGRPGAD